MEGQAPRSSVLGSATVVAAVISGMTALVTALMPWLFGPPTPEPGAPPSPAVHAAADASAISAITPTPQALPSLTHGVWTIVTSVDEAGTDFKGSTLKFLSQHAVAGGLEATGFFEWRSNYELIGREQVVANYDAASRRLYIQGREVDRPDLLAVGSFSAKLSEDGQQLLEGSWGNTPGYQAGILGTWEARR